MHLLFDCLCNLLAGNRTECSSSFTDFHGKYDFSCFEFLCQFFRCIQVLLCNLGFIVLLQLQVIEIFPVCFYPKLFRQNKVSRISVIYIDNLSFFSRAFTSCNKITFILYISFLYHLVDRYL